MTTDQKKSKKKRAQGPMQKFRKEVLMATSSYKMHESIKFD